MGRPAWGYTARSLCIERPGLSLAKRTLAPLKISLIKNSNGYVNHVSFCGNCVMIHAAKGRNFAYRRYLCSGLYKK